LRLWQIIAIVKANPERAVITLATFTLTSIAICIFMAIHQNLQSRSAARLHETCGRALVVTDLLIGRAGCEIQDSPDTGRWPPNGVLANTPGRGSRAGVVLAKPLTRA